MNYQVLARKWRPKKFSEVVGQQHIIQPLVHSFMLRKIHHAYVLSGTRGIGKTTIARLIAKGLNCLQGITSDICCKCLNCQNIDTGCFIDLIEIDAASRTKVEDTREFLENVSYMPSMGRFKVYLIDEIHMLSKHSFNALLKILEEPPIHVKFVLVTTEPQKIPATILSRCLHFYLKPLSNLSIINQLTHIFNVENIKIEKIALESLAQASKGSLRDALNLAEQAIATGNNAITTDTITNMFGIVHIEHPLSLMESLIKGDINNIICKVHNYSDLGVNWDYFLNEMLIILQKIAIYQFSPNYLKCHHDVTSYVDKRIHELSEYITPENVQLYYQILLLGRRELPYSPTDQIGIEIIMLRALAFRPHFINNNKSSDCSSNIQSNKHNNNDNNNSNNNNDNNNNNCNIQKNISYNDQENNNTSNNVHTLKQQNNNDHLLSLKKDHIQHNKINNTQLISPEKLTNTIMTNNISRLLSIRSELLKKKESKKLDKIDNKVDLIKKFEKNTSGILEKFSNIHKNFDQKKIDNTPNILDMLFSENLQCRNNDNNSYTNNNENNVTTLQFIKEILQTTIKYDPWILQIYQLSLTKPAKKLVMNAWKEDVSSNKICLHVRSNYFHLNNIHVRTIIQIAISKKIGRSVILEIKEDDRFLKNTPMEYINKIYEKKISGIQQKFLEDPYIKLIQLLFDAHFDEKDIVLLS